MTNEFNQDLPSPGRFAPDEHRYPLRVYLEDIGGGQHVYNGNFLRYFERARTDMFQLATVLSPEIGQHPYERYQVVAVQMEFKRPASLHDVLVITTRIAHVGRSSCALDHVLVREGECIATGKISLVFTAIDGRPTEQPRGWIEVFGKMTTRRGVR